MERSDPMHWTLLMWIGPVPGEEGEHGGFKDYVETREAYSYLKGNLSVHCALRPPTVDTQALADVITQRRSGSAVPSRE